MASKERCKLLVVGSAGIDFVASLPRFPHPDEKIRSTSLLVDGGGNAANTASAIAKLSPFAPSVDVATAVGSDANAELILGGLRDVGVGVDGGTVQRYHGTSSFTYVIAAPAAAGDEPTRTCIHQPGDGELTADFADAIIPPLGKGGRGRRYGAVHFDVRHPAAAIRIARRCAVAAGGDVPVPYSVDVERPREGLRELLEGAAIVICNSRYCDAVLGETPQTQSRPHHHRGGAVTDDARRRIVQRLKRVMERQAPRAKILLTTLGVRGSCLVRVAEGNVVACEDEDREIVAQKRDVLRDRDDGCAPVVTFHHGALWCTTWNDCKVVDTTGAGDALQGGFLAALWAYADAAARVGGSKSDNSPLGVPLDDMVLARALRIGTTVACRKVEMSGARKGLPSAVEDVFLRAEFTALLALAEVTQK